MLFITEELRMSSEQQNNRTSLGNVTTSGAAGIASIGQALTVGGANTSGSASGGTVVLGSTPQALNPTTQGHGGTIPMQMASIDMHHVQSSGGTGIPVQNVSISSAGSSSLGLATVTQGITTIPTGTLSFRPVNPSSQIIRELCTTSHTSGQTITLTLASAGSSSVGGTGSQHQGGGSLGVTTSSGVSMQNANLSSANHPPVAVHYGPPHAQTALQTKMTPANLIIQPVPNSVTVPSHPNIPGPADCEDAIHSQNVGAIGQANSDPSFTVSQEHPNPGQSEQRLKVEDALNYLDQVKYKFGNQPQVYNDFLDIMKEFKSQSIDTPGVISRVSTLFRGHPELITGFNTFLPPGYKIEFNQQDQVQFSVLQGGNYMVQTIPTGNMATQVSHQPAASPAQTNSAHHPASVPLRSASHSAHIITHGSYTSGGNNLSVPNGRSGSPLTNQSLPASNANFEPSSTGSTFTHSFSSPFVQSAFPSLQSQPVEFNHAINYVNKIKNRFHGQPEKYKKFLEILHTYQKEHKEGAPSSSKHLTEHEVYSQVAKLFENQEDLLQEFGQFLPDATYHVPTSMKPNQDHGVKKPTKVSREYVMTSSLSSKPSQAPGKRPAAGAVPPASKKQKTATFRDISLTEAGKYGTLNEFAFFDKVRHCLKHPDVYDNFLRCLALYNDEVVSRNELLTMVTPFLSRFSDLYAWFKDFIGTTELARPTSPAYEPIPQNIARQERERPQEGQVMEIDFSTCKRLGASYCAYPKTHIPPKSSNRTSLCNEVLNDVWVSFPSFSEDSTFVASKKTQYEEYIYRCEDERFELDVVIETNVSTIQVLENVMKKISRMSSEAQAAFRLDDCLGGTSPTIHQRAVKRLYGEKAQDIIESLKRQPTIAVPLVLRRLKAKDEEWREAQLGFNKIWREQIERFYLKSLDHQGISFKQQDIKALKSKALITEIVNISDERNEHHPQDITATKYDLGPHMTFHYKDRALLDDACNLLLHHVRRQSGISKEDKRKIKLILKHLVPDFFAHPRMEMSDDENEDGPHEENESMKVDVPGGKNGSKRNGNSKRSNGGNKGSGGNSKKDVEENIGKSGDSTRRKKNNWPEVVDPNESRRTKAKRESRPTSTEPSRYRRPDHARQMTVPSSGIAEVDFNPRIVQLPAPTQDETYVLFFANNNWYVFLRLHQILCERLNKIMKSAVNIMVEESKEFHDSKNSASIALRLKPRNSVPYDEYYGNFLELVKNLLDGHLDTSLYEDTLREMFGIHAFIAYTMDKLIINSVRILQSLVSDELSQKCLELFHEAQRKGGAGGLTLPNQERTTAERLYQQKAERAFVEDNCIKVMMYQKSSKMTIELLESPDLDETVIDPDEKAKWSLYLNNFMNPSEIVTREVEKDLDEKPILLPRNIRNWKKWKRSAYMNHEKHPNYKGSKPADDVKQKRNKTKEQNKVSDHEMADDFNIQADLDGFPDIDSKTSKEITSSVPDEGTVRPVTQREEVELIEKALQEKIKEKGGGDNDYIIQENLQCQFNPKTYKFIYVVNSENFIYLKGALKRAKECQERIAKVKEDKFLRWHQAWFSRNAAENHQANWEAFATGNHSTILEGNPQVENAENEFEATSSFTALEETTASEISNVK